jgi:phosphoribosyl 1,2-cyclic phosphate phosphodiesterase
MTITLTILGCGSSGGVPRIGGDWGLCDPANPKNRRRRCSVMLEKTEALGTTRLIDTSPDLREQMLSENVGEIDGVWFTHEHADHTHGIDELRGFFLRQRRLVPIWADAPTTDMLKNRFSYCFQTLAGSSYPPVLLPNLIQVGQEVATTGAGGTISAVPFLVHHGNLDVAWVRIEEHSYHTRS